MSERGQIQETAGNMGALGDVLNKLMAHPEVLTYVASAIGVDKDGATSAEKPSEEPKTPSEPATPTSAHSSADSAESGDAMATLAPLLSGLSGLSKGGGGGQKDCRAALLLALKPYVSRGRCEAIDTMLRFSKLTDLFKTLH